ncbi:MAG: isoprenylcysteine carboxylmethyltransferase family protein [Candidatus Omnitrophica bacterium]|nr:isoprenylcysteine carboxylmethyltransferase family protein [Candidatus Omnitrophota bacterium]
MNIAQRLQRSFKPRFAVIYPFGLFVMFFCSLDEASIRAGIGFIIAGALIRLWSNGYAIKNDKLTSSGPYAFVRNPLYLGTFLIATGFVIVLKSDPRWLEWTIGGMFLLALCFVYYRTIKDEQDMLLAKFANAYSDYCKKVPAMVPCLVPYNKGEKWPFNLQRLINSKEHKPVFWIFILLVIFHIKTRILIEHKALNDASWNLVTAALFLIIIDAAYEFNKKKFQPKA